MFRGILNIQGHPELDSITVRNKFGNKKKKVVATVITG